MCESAVAPPIPAGSAHLVLLALPLAHLPPQPLLLLLQRIALRAQAAQLCFRRRQPAAAGLLHTGERVRR